VEPAKAGTGSGVWKRAGELSTAFVGELRSCWEQVRDTAQEAEWLAASVDLFGEGASVQTRPTSFREFVAKLYEVMFDPRGIGYFAEPTNRGGHLHRPDGDSGRGR
jgi:hypothetical protein